MNASWFTDVHKSVVYALERVPIFGELIMVKILSLMLAPFSAIIWLYVVLCLMLIFGFAMSKRCLKYSLVLLLDLKY